MVSNGLRILAAIAASHALVWLWRLASDAAGWWQAGALVAAVPLVIVVVFVVAGEEI